jgi:hypothetical protein
VQPFRNIDKLFDRLFFSAKLDQINAAFDHCFSSATCIRFFDVAEINDAVEIAIVYRPHKLRASARYRGKSSHCGLFTQPNRRGC